MSIEHRPMPEPPAWGSLDVRDVMRRWWAHRVRLVAVSAVAALLTLGVAFLLPKWYRATAVILPPEESDLLSNMSITARALSKFPRFGVLDEYFTPADIFKAVLTSRTAQEEIARQFDLQNVYKKKSLEKTLKELREHTKVRLNPDGTIALSVEDTDAKRAANMANAYLVALDRYNVEKRNTQARRTRQFLEQRVAMTDSLLRVTEDILKRYQESQKTIVPSWASVPEVRAAAELMARKTALEVRLGVLRSYLSPESEQITQTQVELRELERRIQALPRQQNELVRMVRDAKIQEQLYLLLTSELEQARIRETMNTPTVQVLDPAVPPERHAKPRRLLLALAAGILAGGAYAVWLALRDEDATAPAP